MSGALDSWIGQLGPEPTKLLEGGKAIHLVVPGAPRTKKNSPVLARGITYGFLTSLIWDMIRPWMKATTTKESVEAWVRRANAKDNPNRIQWPRQRLLPSKPYREWESAAAEYIIPRLEGLRAYLPINYPVHIMALIYREANQGDWVGYTQGIGDFLQKLGVITNDVLICHWDGTRLRKDADSPRVELWISAYSPEGDTGLFAKTHKDFAAGYKDPPPQAVEPETASRLQLLTVYNRRTRQKDSGLPGTEATEGIAAALEEFKRGAAAEDDDDEDVAFDDSWFPDPSDGAKG